MGLALGFFAAEGCASESGFRIRLDERAYDAREPASADFLDCGGPDGRCQAVAIPRVMPDEKATLPRNKTPESFRFLSLKGIRAQGGDPQLTLALTSADKGDSVYADLNNDEDLGNDGPAKPWPKRDSCVTLERIGGGASPIQLCRAGDRAKAWRGRCESLKGTITWAMCEEDPVRIRLLDLRSGWLEAGGKHWWIAACDVDADGHIRLDGGDRLVVDWDGDGVLAKSPEAEGFAAVGAEPLRFSVDTTTFEVVGADENGGWLEVRRLAAYDPAAAAARAAEGKPAPDIRFVNMDGDTLKLSDLRGKKVLLHFWSTLCKPCLDNLEAVRGFWKSFGGKNWQVVSLTTETDLSAVQQAVLKRHMDWMVGMAGPEARRFYAGRPLPVLVRVNERGIVESKTMELGPRPR